MMSDDDKMPFETRGQANLDHWSTAVADELIEKPSDDWVASLARHAAAETRATNAAASTAAHSPVQRATDDRQQGMTNVVVLDTSLGNRDLELDDSDVAIEVVQPANVLAFPEADQEDERHDRLALLAVLAAAVLAVVGIAVSATRSPAVEGPADSIDENDVSELPFAVDDSSGDAVTGADHTVSPTDPLIDHGTTPTETGPTTEGSTDEGGNIPDDAAGGPATGSEESADPPGAIDQTEGAPLADNPTNPEASAVLEPTIDDLVLVDAANGQTVSTLADGATLNLTELPERFRVHALVAGGTDTVTIILDGQMITDATTPFVVSTTGGWEPTIGDHTLSATPFAGAGAERVVGEEITLDFTIVDDRPPVSWPEGVTGVTLLDARSNAGIVGLHDGQVIDIADVGTALNIRADASQEVASVRFTMNGADYIHVENVVPYALFGDIDGDYFDDRWDVAPGVYTITMTPFGDVGAAGPAGTTRTITITFIDSSN